MNILILSPGRRVDIVNYFKECFNKDGGKVFTADMSPYAPALYEGDENFLLKKDFDHLDKYVEDVISLCVTKKVSAILTLIDPELVLLADNRKKFLDNNIIPIVSSKEMIDLTFDKYLFYEKLKDKLPLLPTYSSLKNVCEDLNIGKIKFPLFAKIRNGSGSAGIGKIDSMEELNSYKDKENYIFQPCNKKNEFGCDIYFDMKSGKIVSFFIKQKLNMRSGETDKSISVKNKDIENLIMKLEDLDFSGPIDMDVFEGFDGKYYVNEINPRFGGGYPHAYNCGVNFIKEICTNLNGIENKSNLEEYPIDVLMMKYNGVKCINKSEINNNTIQLNGGGAVPNNSMC